MSAATTVEPDSALAQDAELVAMFIAEASEHVRAIDWNMLRLEKESGDAEALYSAFRRFHTIKALAGFLEYAPVRDVAHEVEAVLAEARAGQVPVGGAMIAAVLEGSEFVRRWITALEKRRRGRSPATEGAVRVTARIRGRVANGSQCRAEASSIGVLFARMQRIADQLVHQVGKEAKVVAVGNDVRIGRGLKDALTEPLLHLLRNAVDHGLESNELRKARGKVLPARLELRAHAEGGWVTIEVSDDGNGLDVGKILERARRMGLVEDGAVLAECDVFRFIFEPGLSTADKVTELSGRGVGMDVVRRQIQKLSGRIDIRSAPGQGSTFVLTLPETISETQH